MGRSGNVDRRFDCFTTWMGEKHYPRTKKMKSKTRKDGNLRKRQIFDFYPTCSEKTKHVGIFTPGCFFPHMFGFWHIGMGKGTHVWKKAHMCEKSHTIICVQMFGIFHTCVGKATDMLISPWAIGAIWCLILIAPPAKQLRSVCGKSFSMVSRNTRAWVAKVQKWPTNCHVIS